MFSSSRCQPLNIIYLWSSSKNIGVTANKNMFFNNVQTFIQFYNPNPEQLKTTSVGVVL